MLHEYNPIKITPIITPKIANILMDPEPILQYSYTFNKGTLIDKCSFSPVVFQ